MNFFKFNFIKQDLFFWSSLKLLFIIFGFLLFIFNYIIFYYFVAFYNSTSNNFVWNTYNSYIDYTFIFSINSVCLIKFSPDLFGTILLLLAIFVAFISFFTMDTRFFYKNIKYMIVCYLLIFFIYVYSICTDFFFFFFCYEGLLFPSFWLVYILSPNRRSIQASLYFLLWTQLGSLLVLFFVTYIYELYGVYFFSDLIFIKLSDLEAWFLYLLLFVGFGFKVPVWPFHFWLTKTHVEAPTGFSIFLSGFLVKSALYGFYKLNTLLGSEVNTTIFATIVVLGIMDSSLKMWGQTDLKKLVAYGTVQEMNIIFLTFCYGDTLAVFGGIFFCVTHAFLSALFFYFVDCIYRRYKTRLIAEIQGLLHINPLLGIFVFLGCVFYSGLPGTLKFLCEFYIFSGLIDLTPITALLMILSANLFGILGFCKCWFNVTFGSNTRFQKILTIDVTSREFFLIFFCFTILVIGCFNTIWF